MRHKTIKTRLLLNTSRNKSIPPEPGSNVVKLKVTTSTESDWPREIANLEGPGSRTTTQREKTRFGAWSKCRNGLLFV